MERYLLGEYLPDLPSFGTDALALASNIVPTANGYGPIGQFAPASNGVLPGACKGAAAYRHENESYIFAADATDLYRYTDAGHTSLAGGLSNNAFVRFCAYARFMLATNGTDPIKRFDPANPTTMTNLGADAPIAAFLGVVRGFLVAGDCDGETLRVQWSDSGDPAAWLPGPASLAGQYDMPSGGAITGVIGGEYGLIFQENRIVRMTFTGDDAIWQWDEVSSNLGCVAPNTLVTWNRRTWFLSAKGFMVYDGDTGLVVPIGEQRIDRTFLARADPAYHEAVSAAFDPVNALYVVSVPNADPPTEAFVFSSALGRWTTLRLAVERFFSAFGLNYTLEDLDAIYASLDAMDASLDNPAFRGGRPLLMLYDGQHRIGTLNGPNAEATIVDAQREPAPMRKTRLRTIRPITDAATLTVSVNGYASLADTPTTTHYGGRSSGGVYRVRENWNIFQLGVTIPADTNWSFILGIDVDGVAGGRA